MHQIAAGNMALLAAIGISAASYKQRVNLSAYKRNARDMASGINEIESLAERQSRRKSALASGAQRLIILARNVGAKSNGRRPTGVEL